MPAALVMQGWVDVRPMGCSSLAVPTSDLHSSKAHLSYQLTSQIYAFLSRYQS
jgi:hypothetical protein